MPGFRKKTRECQISAMWWSDSRTQIGSKTPFQMLTMKIFSNLYYDGAPNALKWKSRFYVKMFGSARVAGLVLTKISEAFPAFMTHLEITLFLDWEKYH